MDLHLTGIHHVCGGKGAEVFFRLEAFMLDFKFAQPVKIREISIEVRKKSTHTKDLTDFFLNPIGQLHKLVHAELLRTLRQLWVSQEFRMIAVG